MSHRGGKSGLSNKPIFPQPPCPSEQCKHDEEPEAHASGARTPAPCISLREEKQRQTLAEALRNWDPCSQTNQWQCGRTQAASLETTAQVEMKLVDDLPNMCKNSDDQSPAWQCVDGSRLRRPFHHSALMLLLLRRCSFAIMMRAKEFCSFADDVSRSI